MQALSPSERLRSRLLAVVGASGLVVAGVGAVRAMAPAPSRVVSPAASASHERLPPGTYPPPSPEMNACYLAGGKTAPRPCLDRSDALLPRLIGQCERSATRIDLGPVEAQYANSPAVLCCYRATPPTCSGRPLRVAERARTAAPGRRGDWG